MMDREFGPGSNTKVDVWLTFRNDKDSGMGMPLPAGRIRVSQQDKADGSLEFIGEDMIEHTPKDEDVRVKLGTAFDVVGERRQTDFTVNSKGRVMEEAFEIKVRNHKDAAGRSRRAREPLPLEPVAAHRAVAGRRSRRTRGRSSSR